MKRTFTIAAVCSFLLSAGAAEIVLAAPGYRGTEGEIVVPTLPMAVETAVALAGRRPELKEITVECKDGIYELASPVVISKSPAVPLVIRPEKGAKVAFDGGLRLTDWKKMTLNGRDALVARVPSDATIDGQLPRLYVNGRPAVPASIPKKLADAFKAKEIGVCDTQDMNGAAYVVPDPGDFPAVQYDLGNVHLLAIERWNAETRGKLSYDEGNGRIVIHAKRNFPDTMRFVLLNVREALLGKGEYCYDKTKGEMTYIPRDGESAETMDARIPRTSAPPAPPRTPRPPPAR
ncbi:MAG: hypothetical protein MJ025_04245, partial [Victivallaceae bacterium]|nr:hypothetical protein [Victivallaceae bacterium]